MQMHKKSQYARFSHVVYDQLLSQAEGQLKMEREKKEFTQRHTILFIFFRFKCQKGHIPAPGKLSQQPVYHGWLQISYKKSRPCADTGFNSVLIARSWTPSDITQLVNKKDQVYEQLEHFSSSWGN